MALHITYQAIDTKIALDAIATAANLEPRQWYWATDEDRAYYAADNSTLVTVIDSSIYTADGTLLSNRVITLDDKSFELFDYADDLTGGVLTHGRYFQMVESAGNQLININADAIRIGDGTSQNSAFRRIVLTETAGNGQAIIEAPGVLLSGHYGLGSPSKLTIKQFNDIELENINSFTGFDYLVTLQEINSTLWSLKKTSLDNMFFGSIDVVSPGAVWLKNDATNPGNEKYYGTNAIGTKGWFDLPGGGGGSSKWSQGTGEIFHTTDQVRIGEVATDAGRTLKLHGHTENLLEFDSTASSATFRNRILFRANGNPRWLLGTNGVESSGDAGTNLTLFGYNDADTASGFITLMRSGEIRLAKTLRLDYSITEDNTLTNLLAVTANGTVRTVDKGTLGGGGIDAITTESAGANTTITTTNSAMHALTMTANLTATIADFNEAAKTHRFVLKVIQDATGGRTLTIAGNVLFPAGIQPSNSESAGAVDLYEFVWDGTNWLLDNYTAAQA